VKRMTVGLALIVTVAGVAYSYFMWLVAAFILTPFSEPELINPIVGWLCALFGRTGNWRGGLHRLPAATDRSMAPHSDRSLGSQRGLCRHRAPIRVKRIRRTQLGDDYNRHARHIRNNKSCPRRSRAWRQQAVYRPSETRKPTELTGNPSRCSPSSDQQEWELIVESRCSSKGRTFRLFLDLVAQKYQAVFERGGLDQLQVLRILENARSLAA